MNGTSTCWALLASFAVSVGCSHGVERRVHTTPTSLRGAGTGALVVGDMGRPPVVVGIGGPGAIALIPALAVETSARRLDHVERDLYDMLDRAGILGRTVAEADLGPMGLPDAGFYVSINVTSYSEHFEGPDGRYWAGYILGCLTAGLGFLIAIDSHSNSQHTFEFEVRVYDVRGAPVVRTTDASGNIVNRYDTSVAAPLLRRTYNGSMHSWIGAGTGGPTGADLEAFIDAQAEEVAGVIFDAAGEDIARAIRSAPPPAPMVAPMVAPPATFGTGGSFP